MSSLHLCPSLPFKVQLKCHLCCEDLHIPPLPSRTPSCRLQYFCNTLYLNHGTYHILPVFGLFTHSKHTYRAITISQALCWVLGIAVKYRHVIDPQDNMMSCVQQPSNACYIMFKFLSHHTSMREPGSLGLERRKERQGTGGGYIPTALRE